MASYNRVIMMGNLTRDPEHKQIANGQAVCRFGLASNRQFKNKQTGMMVQEVCFMDVDVWGPQAETCRQYLQKGRSVLVEGRIKMDSWQDQSGNNRNRHLIVADRVTFLQAGAGASEDAELGEGAGMSDEQSAAPAADFQAARPAAAPAPKARAPRAAAAPTGEVSLKNEAPFEDELPF